MTIGQAAGVAASLAIQHHVSVQDVPVDKLRAELQDQKVPLEPMFRPRVAIELDGSEKARNARSASVYSSLKCALV